jgi:hypothetical protein
MKYISIIAGDMRAGNGSFAKMASKPQRLKKERRKK